MKPTPSDKLRIYRKQVREYQKAITIRDYTIKACIDNINALQNDIKIWKAQKTPVNPPENLILDIMLILLGVLAGLFIR